MEASGPVRGYVVHTGSGRAVPLPVDRAQLRSLSHYLDGMVGLLGCDHSLSHAEAWARAHQVRWGRLARSVRSLGAFCDCEVGTILARS
jgi:Protein of unknown function (DUF2695)